MLIDTHCHLGDGAFDADRDDVVRRAGDAGVSHVVVIRESVTGSERAVDLARVRPGLSATAGVHPHEARTWTAEAERRIRALLGDPAVVAVGETGLDYHYDHSPRPAQRTAFEAHLALAAEFGKPVVVHAREADDDVASLVREWGARVPALVLHSFSGGRTIFEAGMAVGAYFSFSGMITFKNWNPAIPLTAYPSNRLFVETDAPYLAPVPHRGRRNEPAFVRLTAERLATARGETIEALAAATTANAHRVFGARLSLTL